ncbi:MAG TPA: CAP domain-containing protein [Bacteriovoracaceae bacterium]|nr:CAP domain-containing protein [Bacteriovoracaceae bacterium]
MTKLTFVLTLLLSIPLTFAQSYYDNYTGPSLHIKRIQAKRRRFTTPTPAPETAEQKFKREFLAAVNAHRALLGFSALTYTVAIDPVAQSHSQNMSSGAVPFGHDGITTRCQQIYPLVTGETGCSENVAAGYEDPQLLLRDFLNSPGHRANIERQNAKYTGLGLYRSTAGMQYFTQLFIQN